MAKDERSRSQSIYFLRKFLKDPLRVGSIVPSSRFLAEAMTRDLDVRPGDLVLEYGPGTGIFTQVLDRRLPSGVLYLGIENDADFHRILKQRFPHLAFHLGSVEDVTRILRRYRLPRPKAIISGLPFVGMKPALMRRIVEATRQALRPDGVFRTFTYVNAYPLPGGRRLRVFMTEIFSDVRMSRPILRNVPPAIVFTARP
jgi:phosphatidylethanolamine/phosphatidyl-N-methylethanolamine N-methyltransferase